MSAHVPVVVIGGGQAGLSMSRHLVDRSVEHVVLERDRAFHEWRDRRWDSFCLVTPNWQCRLPGFDYDGSDPDGFMVKSEVLDFLDRFRGSFEAPLREGVAATGLRREDGRFVLDTGAGRLTADAVVLATGPYQTPVVPPLTDALPAGLAQLHSSAYKNAEALPRGAVLVVGTGQSGAQIAEDLHLSGRQVHLCVGGAPRVSRRYRGRDIVAWLHDMGHYDRPVAEHGLAEGVRERANHYVTGRGGGRDIDLRAFARDGMALHGRLLSCTGGTLSLAGDLAANLDAADQVNDNIKDAIDAWLAATATPAPPEPRYVPVWQPGPAPETLDLVAAGIGSVVWATGYLPDYSWIDLPVLDGTGYPRHDRGVTAVPGLYVLGLPWLHTWGSARFAAISRDAEHLTGHLAGRLPIPA